MTTQATIEKMGLIGMTIDAAMQKLFDNGSHKNDELHTCVGALMHTKWRVGGESVIVDATHCRTRKCEIVALCTE